MSSPTATTVTTQQLEEKKADFVPCKVSTIAACWPGLKLWGSEFISERSRDCRIDTHLIDFLITGGRRRKPELHFRAWSRVQNLEPVEFSSNPNSDPK